MKIDGWGYYNHAVIPTTAPGKNINMEPIEDSSIWKIDGGYPLFARWISDYDCGYATEWWYCIKDNKYEIESLNSKKRYRINKGRKNFDIRVINESDWIDDLIMVLIKAYSQYPEYLRPNLDADVLKSEISSWKKDNHKCFGAFKKDTNELCGYGLIYEYDDFFNFAQLKTNPDFEKEEINAAICDGICLHYNDELQKGFSLVDGQRNLFHKTSFQDYLCRIFGFRYAYCRLNIKYRWWLGIIIKILFPFRKTIEKCSKLQGVYSILKLEEVRRSFK